MLLAILMAMQAPAQVAELGWMSGRWEAAGENGRWTEESWSAPRAGIMLGHSRSGRGEALREFELLRLQAGEDGVPVYLAQPGGAPAVPFRLTAHDANSATFDNPGHDFPQRIRYQRNGESMTATISAIDGTHAMSWTFTRR